MKIGILIAGPIADVLQPKYGDYGQVFEHFLSGHDFTYQHFFAFDGDIPSDPHACDGWLISGSKHGAYDALPWIKPLETLIRDIHAAQIPLVGICFGHQVIAQALGGKVEKYSGGWAVGRQIYDTADGPLTLSAWHQDQVTELPEDARVLASDDFCPFASLAIGRSTLTYQAHPEFETPYLRDLIDKRGRGIIPDDLLDAAEATADIPRDNAATAARIAQFFKQAQVPA